jgi:hypothetical protein
MIVHELEPFSVLEVQQLTTAKNAGAHIAARPAFGLVRCAVAARFEQNELR